MCGIVGFVQQDLHAELWQQRLTAMSDRLAHRGPDDSGQWFDAAAGIGFGHRRLAIVDLSPRGHQPMWCAQGRFCLSFNGEIYNYRALMAELAELGHTFRGHSDTEVLLAACQQWGVEGALERANGMFAISLWDARRRRLYLVCDRLGEKPLYYGWQGGAFLFGSELKALRAHPEFAAEVDRGALALLLRHNYIPAPHSIYQGLFKLPPAHLLVLEVDQAGARPEPRAYWSARAAAERGLADPLDLPPQAAVDLLERELTRAVGLRMEADVPLGAFLSGGIDSSLVVALMQAQSPRPVRTFSIGFHVQGFDEAPFARAVAEHLGTDHTELYVTAQEAQEVIPRLPQMYCEPFSDVSQIPTFLVSRLAAQHVKVSLSGDGGDELFGGYRRYLQLQQLWRSMAWLPRPLRKALAGSLSRVPVTTLDRLLGWLGPRLVHYGPTFSVGDKLHKLTDVLGVGGPEDLYLRLVSHWPSPEALVLGAREPLTVVSDRGRWAQLPHLLDHMMYLDLVSYLPGDILVKVDRASMAVGLEGRVPLLDHPLVELAWRLPRDLKVRAGKGKWLLRQVLKRHLPEALVERPKMGFGVPMGDWLRGPLREWAEALLEEGRLRQEGWFDPAPIRERWQEHLSERRNWQYLLWDVLVFQQWLEAQRSD